MKSIAYLFVIIALGSRSFAQIQQFTTSHYDEVTNEYSMTWPAQVGYDYGIQKSSNFSTWTSCAKGWLPAFPRGDFAAVADLNTGEFFRVSRTSPAINSEPCELLSNTGFNSFFAPWFLVNNNGAIGSLGITGGELEVSISNGGTAIFHLQLIHSGFELKQNSNYTLSFDAYAVGGNRTIRSLVQSTSEPSQNTYLSQEISLTTTKQSFTFPFTMTAVTQATCRVAFNLGTNSNTVIFDNISLVENCFLSERVEAHQLNRRLAIGNNFAAYMAVPGQGAAEDYLLLRENGFSHCRIGYRLDEFVGSAPTYTVPTSHLDEIQRLVDLCLAQGLIAIVDPIHNWANGPGFTYPGDSAKFRAIWNQVATRFANYSTEQVVFELLNEPHGGSQIASVTAEGLAEVRAIAGNEKRMVIVSGEGFTTRQALINAFNNDFFPTNDPSLIATFHYYEPKPFTTPDTAGSGSAIPWADGGASDSEFAAVEVDFDAVLTANASWASRNGTEVLPVYLGEFGCDNISAESDRKRWLAWVQQQATLRNFSTAHWLMYNDLDFSKGMGPWTLLEKNTPSTRVFQQATVDALGMCSEAEDESLTGDAAIITSIPNASGSGAVRLPGVSGSISLNPYTPRAQSYLLAIRYTATSAVTLNIVSRDSGMTILASHSVNLSALSSDLDWGTAEQLIILDGDGAGTLEFSNSSGAQVDIDFISWSIE